MSRKCDLKSNSLVIAEMVESEGPKPQNGERRGWRASGVACTSIMSEFDENEESGILSPGAAA